MVDDDFRCRSRPMWVSPGRGPALSLVVTLGALASSPISPLAGRIATVYETMDFLSVITATYLTSAATAHVLLGLWGNRSRPTRQDQRNCQS